MSKMTKLNIDSEAMAWEVLEKALKGVYDDKSVSLSLDNWAGINLHFVGGNFESSITPGVMSGFLDLQKAINRAAAALIYNEPNALRLTAEDRKSFELVIAVSGGSSNFDINLSEIINTMIEKVGDKMSGKQLIIAILGLAVLYTADVAWKDYLVAQAEQAKVDLTYSMSKEETKRLQILKDTIQEEHKLSEIREDLRDSQHQLLRSGIGAKAIEMQGVSIAGANIEDISKTKRERATDVRFKEKFRILAVDTSNKELVKVKVRGATAEFVASFKDETFDENQLALLKDKLMSRKPVRLVINATMLRDRITTAEILLVEEI